MNRFKPENKTKAIEKKEKYKAEAVTQLWAQYRHVEDNRIKLFSLFVTVILAASGFVTTQLNDANLNNENSLVGMAFFLFFVFSFVFICWGMFTKWDIEVYSHKEKLIKARGMSLRDNNVDIDPLEIDSSVPDTVRDFFIGPNPPWTVIAATLGTLLIMVNAYLTCVVNIFSSFSLLVRIFETLLTGLSLLLFIWGLWFNLTWRKAKNKSVSRKNLTVVEA